MMKTVKKKFFCPRGNAEIHGEIYMPENGTNLPIALVCHGFMANRKSCCQYAELLADNGFAAFCFDFCGGGLLSSSKGKTEDMTVLTEVEDVKAVIAYAKAQDFTDGCHITLLGCSQGGFVCGLTAAELGSEIERLIMLYPALCIPDDARRGSMLMMKFDPENIPEMLHCGPMKIGRKYVTDVNRMDAFEMVSEYHGNVLIIHGDKDRCVNISNSVKAYERYKAQGTNVKFVTIPGADHGFSGKNDKQAQAEILAMIRHEQE